MLSKQSPLHTEGALLSRFVYKYDKKFRNDIGYRNLKKSYSSLHKYMQINLLKDVENFAAVIPDENEDFVPTRQMLEYVLTRIITFSRLMVRIYVCSKQGAVFYLDRVKRGQNHWMSLMPYALLSRVWSICSVLLHHATSWYSCLQPYLALLQVKGVCFLPQDYELPIDLHQWLDLKNLDTFGKSEWAEKKLVNIALTLDDEYSFDNILEYAKTINNENTETDVEKNLFSQLKVKAELKEQFHASNISNIDHGEAISRDKFKSLNQQTLLHGVTTCVVEGKSIVGESCKILTNFQKRISNDNKSNHYFGKVVNVKSLKDFLDVEETFRNDGNKLSLTKHLSFMQWHTLKMSLLKMCDSLLNNRKIERKLSRVWKEKCLDYM